MCVVLILEIVFVFTSTSIFSFFVHSAMRLITQQTFFTIQRGQSLNKCGF